MKQDLATVTEEFVPSSAHHRAWPPSQIVRVLLPLQRHPLSIRHHMLMSRGIHDSSVCATTAIEPSPRPQPRTTSSPGKWQNIVVMSAVQWRYRIWYLLTWLSIGGGATSADALDDRRPTPARYYFIFCVSIGRRRGGHRRDQSHPAYDIS